MYGSVSRETLVYFTNRFLLTRERFIFQVKQAIR